MNTCFHFLAALFICKSPLITTSVNSFECRILNTNIISHGISISNHRILVTPLQDYRLSNAHIQRKMAANTLRVPTDPAPTTFFSTPAPIGAPVLIHFPFTTAGATSQLVIVYTSFDESRTNFAFVVERAIVSGMFGLGVYNGRKVDGT